MNSKYYLVIIGILAVLVVVLLIIKTPKNYSENPGAVFDTSNTHEYQPSTADGTEYTNNQTNTPTGLKTYTNTNFGFSLNHPQSFVVSTDNTGKVSLNMPGATTNPTTVTTFTGSAPNGSGKFGSYTISYANNGWVVEQQNEQSGALYTAAINPIGYTTSGLPIFGSNMTHGFGMYSYVVALSHTTFVKITGDEGPYPHNLSTDPTFIITQSVSLIAD